MPPRLYPKGQCRKCSQFKSENDFGVRDKGKYIKTICKKCEVENQQAKYFSTRVLKYVYEEPPGWKVCNDCGKEKPLFSFYSQPGFGKRGVSSNCIKCREIRYNNIPIKTRRKYSLDTYYRHQEKYKTRNRKIQRENIVKLTDAYIVGLMRNEFKDIKIKEVPKEIIEKYRELVELKRSIGFTCITYDGVRKNV